MRAGAELYCSAIVDPAPAACWTNWGCDSANDGGRSNTWSPITLKYDSARALEPEHQDDDDVRGCYKCYIVNFYVAIHSVLFRSRRPLPHNLSTIYALWSETPTPNAQILP